MIEIKTKFDENVTTALNKFAFKRMTWFFVAFSMLLILCGVMTYSYDAVYALFLIIFGVLFSPLVLLLTKVTQKNINKSMSIMSAQTTNYFRFDDNKYYQETLQGDDFKGTSECSYNVIYKAFETNDAFFVYISKMQAHVIFKKDFITGTPDDLRTLLKEKLGVKFKIK